MTSDTLFLSFYISCWYTSQLLFILQHSEICAALSKKIFFVFPSSKLKWAWRSFNMKKFLEVIFYKQLLGLLPRLLSAFNDQKNFQWRSTFVILTKFHKQQLEMFCKKSGSGLQLYYKETPTRVFSCKICEILKNTSSDCF